MSSNSKENKAPKFSREFVNVSSDHGDQTLVIDFYGGKNGGWISKVIGRNPKSTLIEYKDVCVNQTISDLAIGVHMVDESFSDKVISEIKKLYPKLAGHTRDRIVKALNRIEHLRGTGENIDDTARID